jgi:hypothetical protein
MILLWHIMTHYNTIIHYYFSYYFSYYDTWDYYFSYYFSYYDTLSVIIFPIIFNYDRVSAPENGNVQTAILDPFIEEWLISVDEGCPLNCDDRKALIENGKQPDAVFKYYYLNYFYYYAHYFYWLTRIPVAVITSYALQIYMQWFCLSQQAEGTSRKLP